MLTGCTRRFRVVQYYVAATLAVVVSSTWPIGLLYKNRRKVKRAKLYFLRDRNPVGTSCSLWGLSAPLFSCLVVSLTFFSLVNYSYTPRIAVRFRNESNEMVASQSTKFLFSNCTSMLRSDGCSARGAAERSV